MGNIFMTSGLSFTKDDLFCGFDDSGFLGCVCGSDDAFSFSSSFDRACHLLCVLHFDVFASFYLFYIVLACDALIWCLNLLLLGIMLIYKDKRKKPRYSAACGLEHHCYEASVTDVWIFGGTPLHLCVHRRCWWWRILLLLSLNKYLVLFIPR